MSGLLKSGIRGNSDCFRDPHHRRRAIQNFAACSLIVAGFLAGCAEHADVVTVPSPTAALPSAPPYSSGPIALLPPSDAGRTQVAPLVIRGTGRFVGGSVTGATIVNGPSSVGDPVTLDFVNVDARDVVRSVLGEVLKLSYTIDPAVQGTVTLQTNQPLARAAVLPALEEALRLSNIAIVEGQGLYKVVPLANAGREARINAQGFGGFVARVVTPHYVAAADLQRVLEPMVPPGTTLRADPQRNVLILSGPTQDVTTLLDNLAVFDVDAMRGMSFELLPLKAASAGDVAKEVTSMLGAAGGSTGLVRIIPLDRLNAVLVTTPQPVYLDRVRTYVERLDKGSGGAGQQLYVYRVQNGRAADLSSVLRKALGIGGGDAPGTSGVTGSGSTNGDEASLPSGSASPVSSAVGIGSPASAGPNPLLGGLDTGTSAGRSSQETGIMSSSGGGGASQAGVPGSDIRITADETNNALLIMSTPQEYATVQAALHQLDIPPLQVMIEATVAEVTLSNQLAYGLQYYVRSGNFQAQFASTATGGSGAPTGGAAAPDFAFAPGLNFALTTASNSSVVLQLLEQLTKVSVLSSPNLLVLNNQTARIQVGDQVPIATGSAVSTLTSNAPIVNSIEYRDTGVILKVTPRVNASGIVSLDISEEVSNVGSTTTSGLDSPTISERRLNSSVAIADGQTIALGGLISDSRTQSKNGIPLLQDIPGLGWLFGTRNNAVTRTELIVLITPHVIRDPATSRAITQELQQKVPLTIPLVTPPRR